MLAIEHYWSLRRRGLNVPNAIYLLIATFRIDEKLPLPYTDRDLDRFVKHAGFRPVHGSV